MEAVSGSFVFFTHFSVTKKKPSQFMLQITLRQKNIEIIQQGQ